MKWNNWYIILFLLLTTVNILPAHAIRKNAAYEKYINKYKDQAIQQQKKYKIPACITLAQALLESNAGESRLAKNSNNHFGIKCHTDWKGARAYHNDDRKNECFRKYKTVLDSYEDHSRFLAERSRYARLFTYKIDDYKKWAKGLQECNYATDRGYANKLIDIIETYQLYNIGKEKKASKAKVAKPKAAENKDIIILRAIYRTHNLIYVIVNDNESLEDIANDLKFNVKKLRKYNEMPEGYPLEKGDIVYMQKKKKKADKPYLFHTVQVGESMHSISQQYGIQIKSLYKMNKKEADFVPEEGDILKLR